MITMIGKKKALNIFGEMKKVELKNIINKILKN